MKFDEENNTKYHFNSVIELNEVAVTTILFIQTQFFSFYFEVR